MVRHWISAAAAASSLSAGLPSGAAPTFASHPMEAAAHVAPRSERARIVGIGAEVRRLVRQYGEAATAAILGPSPLRELGVDGIALADLVLGLETRFGIDIDEADARRWVTVGDVVGFVARRARGSGMAEPVLTAT